MNADAQSSAAITTRSEYFGITYGSSSPTADVIVENGALIAAAGQVNLHASAENTLAVTTLVPQTGDIANLSVSYGKARSHSGVAVQSGATIDAASADVDAENTNSISNLAIAAGFPGSGTLIGIGAALAIGSYQSDANTDVSGNVNVSGDLRIEAHSKNLKDVTRTLGQVAIAPDASNSLVQALTSFLAHLDLSTVVDNRTISPTDVGTDVSLAAAAAP